MGFVLLEEASWGTVQEDQTILHTEEVWFHMHISRLIKKEEETRLSLERTYGYSLGYETINRFSLTLSF